MQREAALSRLMGLYRRHRHRMTAAQRRLAASLLRDARAGRLTRAAAMNRSAALLAKRGLTPQQAWRRLKLSPYYRHVRAVLKD